MRRSVLVVLIAGLLCMARADADEDDGVSVETEEEETVVEYRSPTAESGKFHFAEHFDNREQFEKRWIRSKTKKEGIDEDIAKYDGVWSLEDPQKSILRDDLGLVLKSKAKHAAIAARLNRPFVFADKPLVVQYEVTWQDGQECGGSYIKLLSTGKETSDLGQFHDKTPYTIMFGPDKCGNDAKLHFIFRHVNPINGTVSEKHCKKPKDRLEEPFKDKHPHLYQLVVNPDNTFVVRVDHTIVNEGSLLVDFTPAVNPPREIDDPNDKKPEDWDERERIPDPEAKKPDDWDEEAPPQIPDPNAVKPEGWLDDLEEMIADPNAEKPEDWDNEIDGEWEAPLVSNPLCEKAVGCGMWKAPLIKNPDYKGKWRATYIDNPNYKGKWSPRKIPNPDFFEDLIPFKMTSIAAVGFELWSMSADILFDNLIIADNEEVAREWAAQTFDLKRKQIDRQAATLWERILKRLNYKPGWWAVYFCYCAIPVVGYIVFLTRRFNEETLVSRVAKFTSENPWMWAVYVVAIGLPVTIVFYLCCSGGSKDKVVHPKKTDAPTNEDELREEEELEEEVPILEEEENAAAGGGSEEEDDEAEKNSDPEGEEAADEEVIPPAEPVVAARKRRSRKD